MRRKLALTLFFLLLFVTPVFASFRIGVINNLDGAALKTTLEEMYFLTEIVDAGDIAAREDSSKRFTQAKSLATAYKSENFSDIAKARETWKNGITATVPDKNLLTMEFVLIDTAYSYTKLLSLDGAFCRLLTLENNLDALIFSASYNEGNLRRRRAYIYYLKTDRLHRVFDILALQNHTAETDDEVENAFAPFLFGDNWTALDFLGVDAGASIVVDGIQYFGNKAFVPEGKHIVSISEIGRVSQYYEVESEIHVVSQLTVNLEVIEYGELHLNSLMGKVTWDMNGIPQEGNLPAIVKSQHLPLSITVHKPGFQDASIELIEPKTLLSFEMKPKWMVDSKYDEKDKKDFYNSALRTLVAFAVTLGLQSFAGVDSSGTNWLNIAAGATGMLSYISLADTVFHLLDYYRSTIYSTY